MDNAKKAKGRDQKVVNPTPTQKKASTKKAPSSVIHHTADAELTAQFLSALEDALYRNNEKINTFACSVVDHFTKKTYLEVSAPTTIFADIIDCIFDIKEDIEQVEQITASASNKTLRMLRKYKLRLTKILDIYGVKEFCDTVNVVPFDVNRHKNCGFTHTDNPELEGKISEVIQAGYVRNGTEVIIRQLVNVYDILKVESTVMTETTSPQNN